jgi:hypothetical protein
VTYNPLSSRFLVPFGHNAEENRIGGHRRRRQPEGCPPSNSIFLCIPLGLRFPPMGGFKNSESIGQIDAGMATR